MNFILWLSFLASPSSSTSSVQQTESKNILVETENIQGI